MSRSPRAAPLRLALRAGLSFVPMAVVAGCDKRDAASAPVTSPAAGGSAAAAAAAAGPVKGNAPRPVVKLTPEQYAAEVNANPDAVREKYRDAHVELAGVVEEVGAIVTGDPVVSLRAGPQTPATADAPAVKPIVQCFTRDPEPWGQLAAGQTATFRGVVGYFSGVPAIGECEVVSAGPGTAVAATPADLAAEYAAGRDAFIGKFKGKNLVVAGTVVERKADMAGAITLFLDAGGPVRVRCDFGMVESTIKAVVPAVRVGQQVKVFAEVRPTPAAPPGGDVPLAGCRLITK